MKPASFAYAKARSLGHAIELLARPDGGARVLAGGQSLIAALNMRLDAPRLLVDINGIDGLDQIAVQDGHLQIGATTRQASAMQSSVIARHAPLIAQALPYIGHPAIRNRGTLGGSVALADPAAELPACLLALGAQVDISGPGGERTVKADDFFRGLFETALGPQEVLTAIRVPVATPRMHYGFAELARRHGDYAIVGLAACASVHDAVVTEARLVFFGVGATPVRARGAETILVEGGFSKIDAAAAALAHDLDPGDDLMASGKAKKHLAGVLLRRVVQQLKAPA